MVVVDLGDIGDAAVKRTTIDVTEGDSEFLERYASYRNALAVVQDKKLKMQWSKKSLVESFVSTQCDAARSQLAEMFRACGQLPADRKSVV